MQNDLPPPLSLTLVRRPQLSVFDFDYQVQAARGEDGDVCGILLCITHPSLPSDLLFHFEPSHAASIILTMRALLDPDDAFDDVDEQEEA